MTPEQWRQITAVFHAALAYDRAARDAFLHHACGGDTDVRTEVDRLLAAHHGAGRFGEIPAVADISDLPATFASGQSDRGDDAAAHDLEAARAHDDSVRPARHPFVWVAWCVALGTFATFGYAVALLVANGGATTAFGWNETRRGDQWFVSSVDPAGPAAGQLQPGDRVTAFNGIPAVGRAGRAVFRRAVPVGGTYWLAIDRQGEWIELALPVAEGPNVLATRLTYFFVSLVWCSVGLFIGLARPAQPTARLASAAAVATGLGFLNAVVIQSGPLFHPMHVVLGYHFFCRFPTGRPATGVWRWTLVLLYGIGAVPFSLGLWLHGMLLARGMSGVAEVMTAHTWLFDLRPLLATYVFYASLILIVAVAARNFRQLTDESHRRRVRWVVYGSIVALTPQIVWSAAEIVIGVSAAARFALPANAFTAGIPLVVAYAVVRHRVFDIRVVVRRGLQYLLARRVLQAAAVLPIVALVYTVARHRDLTIAELAGETRGYLYWAGAAALALRFRKPIEGALDRRFFREEFDREQLLLGVLDGLRKADSMSELACVLSNTLVSAMHPTASYVWYRDPDDLPSPSDALLTPPDIPSSGRWLTWLEGRGEATALPLPPEAGLSRRQAGWFRDRGIALIVPITDPADRLVGALLLGEKKSEEPYSAADRQLLGAVARQAAVARENLRLRARVGAELRVRHDVLARLDGRLPDLLKECPACGACFEGAADRCSADGRLLVLSLPVARTIDGRYRLDRLIGKGGMGAVYEARDVRLDRTVAVKILLGRAFGQQAALRRFRREARAAARVSHPNLVPMYDYGSLEGEGAYLVMERVHGLTLRAELERANAMTPVGAADWFDQVLAGVSAAHAAGIIHRDLKPENVMGRRDASGALTVKILDLGLVKLRTGDPPVSGSMTAEGMIMGTPGYMAPEQSLGREVDHRTDIYAIAIMLVEALTGQRPLSRHGSAEAPYAPQPAGRLSGSSPQARALDDLVRRCLTVEPSERPSSAAALREQLIPLLRTCPPLDFTTTRQEP